MGFRTIAHLKLSPRSEKWVLDLPLVYEIEGDIITIPPGFETDLASIPRIAQPFIPVNGLHRSAAIIHDYLFVVQIYDRERTDKIFLQAMKDSNVSWLERTIMYAAIRAFGAVPWERNARLMREDRKGFLASHGLKEY